MKLLGRIGLVGVLGMCMGNIAPLNYSHQKKITYSFENKQAYMKLMIATSFEKHKSLIFKTCKLEKKYFRPISKKPDLSLVLKADIDFNRVITLKESSKLLYLLKEEFNKKCLKDKSI